MARRKKYRRKGPSAYNRRTGKRLPRRRTYKLGGGATLSTRRKLSKKTRRRLRIPFRKRMWIRRKIEFLIREEGYSPKQAAAIAYSMAGVARKRKKRSR